MTMTFPEDNAAPNVLHRGDILDNAKKHTCGDRDVEYGSPVINLAHIATLWQAYLSCKYDHKHKLTSEDVAHMCVLLKMARTFSGQVKPDTYEDMAAYSAIAGECASVVRPNNG